MSRAADPGISAQPRHSVVLRLGLIVMSALFLVDIGFFFPMLAHNRGLWLNERKVEARLIIQMCNGGVNPVPIRAVPWLRRATGIGQLQLTGPGISRDLIPATAIPASAARIDLDRETVWPGMLRAWRALRTASHGMAVLRFGALGWRVDLTVNQDGLHRMLAHFLRRFVIYVCILDSVLLLFLFEGLKGFVIRPLDRMARHVSAFGTNPRHGTPLDPDHITSSNDNEIRRLAKALSEMQGELQKTLWRDARLAAVGTTVTTMSHDLRGILAPAMLAAERLTQRPDPAAQASGRTILDALDRATALARHILAFVADGPPAPSCVPTKLADIAAEAVALASAEIAPGPRIEAGIDRDLVCAVDRASLLRVFANLLRNAAQAGATRIALSTEILPREVSVAVADDGPGLPEEVREALFRPFVPSRTGGSGLGLAIARDLMRAQGGDLSLRRTGPAGTVFVLTLQG